ESCGAVTVIGSQGELRERATEGLDQLKELHRPWIDKVVIRCEACGETVRRIAEVGDAWLDAGIVPFSTLGWHNPEWYPGGYETGREMHKSWGNAIEADVALESMGADIMRWIFAAQTPGQDLNFGFARGDSVKRELLTFWNSVRFLTTYGNIEGFRPRFADLLEGPAGGTTGQELDRWLLARVQDLVGKVEEGFERSWTPAVVSAFESFVDDLSNWYIRRSRRRFYSYDEAAFRTLWYALVRALMAIAPVMPFL